MKYKSIENPTHEEGYEVIEEAIRKKATITIFACCKVIYEGRALSQLNWGERIILIKPDGSFLIHQEKKVDPINWQPPKSRTRTYLKDDTLFLESHRRTPKEQLNVEIKKAHYINYALIEDYEELEKAGYEKDMGDMIMAHPHMIEEGFKPTTREYSTEHGFIDILGKDKDNNLMVLELKCRKAGVSAVKQLKRYLTDFEAENNEDLKDTNATKKKIRGLLVAPSIGEDAKELIEEEQIEFVAIDPPKELKSDKKVTLDIF
ncbi:endonuclease NucS [Methanobrevibacter sp. OttesenSCG-928-K11]|nr:endonuclease NucS [Methanobrevibacter sp. OttesenSCG-928-K11]MDL2270581.1 endonuclease NucS [Methanobrevibacter sp. OttesenSCG-928-I08]